MRLRRFIPLIVAAGALVEAQPATWRVAGVVLNSVTRQPVSRARMSLRPADPPVAPVFAITDAAGRFAFPDVRQGDFTLTAERNGFPVQKYGQTAGGFGSYVITGPGLDTEHLVFEFSPASAISGRVVDDQGDAVQSAMIELFRSSVQGGVRRTRIYRYAYSNDIGEFRLAKLSAGTYYLAVIGKPWYGSLTQMVEFRVSAEVQRSESPLARKAYPITYYPNTSDARAASAIVLKQGEEATANFELRTVSGANVSVRLEGVKSNLRAVLSTAGIGGNETFYQMSSADTPVAFFRSVPPGEYRLSAGPEGHADQTAMKDIEVGAADLDVQLEPGSAPRIRGRVEADGAAAGALSGAYVRLYDPETGHGGNVPLAPDGSFSASAQKGRYNISIGGVKDLSIQGVTIDGSPASEPVIEIEQPVPREMNIRATFSSARVQGRAYRAGRAVAGAMVILAPAGESRNAFDFRAYQTDSDGSFDFLSVRPGRYVLIAVEDGEDLEYANPAVLAPLRPGGRVIDLVAQETLHERVDLPASSGQK